MSKKVTFKLPTHIAANAAEGLLLGDFNNWDMNAGIPLEKANDGSLQTTIELQSGQAYQYRYLLNDGRWENDDTAQHYVSAEGLYVENCVVFVAEPEASQQEEAVAEAAVEKPVVKKKTVVKKAVPVTSSHKDDFGKIEGISKQIAIILHKSEITTFATLAKTSVKKLKEILKSAGPKFNEHNPATWPKQAKLAAAGEWDELKIMQSELKGGK